MTEETIFKYRGFISYSHRDKAWGDWLHKALESYRIPGNLVGKAGRHGLIPKRLFPIFRDREELPTSSDLGTMLMDALTQSHFLIVICSPAATASKWVNEEILAFKRLHGENRILALIVAGEPNASLRNGDESNESFPKVLRYKLRKDGGLSKTRVEPIAADARSEGDGKSEALLKIIAGLLGVNFNDLKQREVAAARRRLRITQSIAAGMAALAVAALVSGYVALWQKRAAVLNSTQSLAALASSALESGQPHDALKLALAAWPRNNDASRPQIDQTIDVFRRAYGLNREVARVDFGSYFDHVAVDQNRKHFAIFESGKIMLHDFTTGAKLGEARINPEDVVNSLAGSFSDDGTLLSYYAGNTAGVLDVKSMQNAVPGLAHETSVMAVAFSPDMTEVVTTAYEDPTATIWNLKTGQRLRKAATTTGNQFSVAYSDDGQYIVGNSGGDDITIWTRNGALVRAITHDMEGTVSNAITPDSRSVITYGEGSNVRFWSLATGEELLRPNDVLNNITQVRFSSDGQHAVMIGSAKDAYIVDLSNVSRASIKIQHDSIVTDAVFASDGKTLFTASGDGTVRRWNVADGTQLEGIIFAGGYISSIALSGDDGMLMLTSKRTTIQLWNTKTLRQVGPDMNHRNNLKQAWMSADGNHVVSLSGFPVNESDTSLRVWNTTPLSHTAFQSQLGGPPTLVEPVDNGSAFLIATEQHKLFRGEISTHSLHDVKRSQSAGVWQILVVPGQRIAYVVSMDSLIEIIDSATGELLKTLVTSLPSADANVIHADDAKIITSGSSGIHMIDPVADRVIGSIDASQDAITATAFNKQDNTLALGRENGRVEIWTMFGGFTRSVQTDGGAATVYSLAFNNTGNRLLVGRKDGSHQMLDAATLKALHQRQETYAIAHVRFTDDANHALVVESVNNSDDIHIFRTEDYGRVTNLHFWNDLNRIRQDKTGRYLLMDSNENKVRIFDFQTSREKPFTLDTNGAVTAMCVDDGQQRVYAVEQYSIPYAWDLTTGAPVLRDLRESDDATFLVCGEAGVQILGATGDRLRHFNTALPNAKGMALGCEALQSASNLQDVLARYQLDDLPPICAENPPYDVQQ